MQNIKASTTPILIFSTRTGTLFNMTPVNHPKIIPGVHLSYGDFHHLVPLLAKLPDNNLNLKQFLGFPTNTLTYLAPYDYHKDKCMCGSQGKSVKIMTNKGYQEIDYEEYGQMIDLVQPDIAVCLTEMPYLDKNHKQESNKSYKRAISKTKSFLDKLVHRESTIAKKPGLFAPIHGATNTQQLQHSIDSVLVFKQAIQGVVLCELTASETIEQREAVFNKVKEAFPENDITICLSGEGEISDIEHAIKFGVKMFQVNVPFRLAEQYTALVFDKSAKTYKKHKPILHEHLEPLDKDCTCNTCKNYSEAYIAHLAACKEMTGKVLLSVHNTHQYLAHFNILGDNN